MSADATTNQTPPIAPVPQPLPPAPAQRPEVVVGAAFAGGLLTALLLKRLRGRG
jgi:hypothetical protein